MNRLFDSFMTGWLVGCPGAFVLISNVFPAGSFFRGSPEPDRHDEHVDPAERHSPSDRNQEGASPAAPTGQVPDHGDAHWPTVVPTAARVSCCPHSCVIYFHILFQELNLEVFIFENELLLYSFLWHIPLTYRTDTSGTIHRHLMTAPTGNSYSPPYLHLYISTSVLSFQ